MKCLSLIVPAKALVLCAVLAVLAFVPVACGAPEIPQRPNVLLVLTDDQPPGTFDEMPQTQEALVREGTAFSQAIITDPVCCPSRATILTGKYTHNHGVLTNEAPAGGAQKFRESGVDRDTVATRLQEEGYRTGYFGKYLNGYDSSYVPPGWDEWFGFVGDLNRSESYEVNAGGEIRSYDRKEDNETDLVREHASEFVADNAKRPWFAIAAPHAPHGPYFPPARHKRDFDDAELPETPSFDEVDVSDKPAYVAEQAPLTAEEKEKLRRVHEGKLETLQAVDDLVGGLVGTLESTGQLDRTYVVFMTDNGYLLGEHRIKSKLVPYEESIRTPFAVRGPDVPAGEDRDLLVANTDVAPTLAALAEAEPPTGADGRSIVPLLSSDPPSAEDWRQSLLVEGYQGGKGKLRWRGIRTPRYAYVEYQTGEKELYDLPEDPYQLDSLHATADPQILGSLHDRLEEIDSCSGDRCRTVEDLRW